MVELFARLIFRLRRLMPTETDLNVRRAVSPLLATLILIAIVVSAGLVVYGIVSGWTGIFGANLKVQAVSVDLVKAGDKALLSVSIKNVGNKPLAGIVVTGYDDNGKPFKLALPPAEPGQASGNTLVIPLGVSNIVLDASGNNNHATMYGAALHYPMQLLIQTTSSSSTTMGVSGFM
jgi:flagellin-like protein